MSLLSLFGPEFVNGYRNNLKSAYFGGEIMRIRPILAKGFQNKVNSASSGPSWGTNRANNDNSPCLWRYLTYSGLKSIAIGK